MRMDNYSNLIGRFFIETAGYHQGETFECTGITKDREGVFMRGFWACGAYTFEPVNGTLKEIRG